MNKFKINKEAAHYGFSVLMHVLILAVIILLQHDFSGGAAGGGGFIQVASGGVGAGTANEHNISKNSPDEQKPDVNQNESDDEKNSQNNSGGNKDNYSANGKAAAGGFGEYGADTTSLQQVYREPTRNVTLKYPVGWSFLDQNVKNKLDGVTFWFSAGNINPPPYIHLEVKEKYLFNEKSFKYNSKQGDYIMYYNDPEEMAGQVSQVIYVRTDSDEDYSIKLIINGWDAFKAFQPTFYGIIKTFKFGKSFF